MKKEMKHWFVCLDMTRMDDIVIAYTRFLSELFSPKTVSFLHIIQEKYLRDDIMKLFSDLPGNVDVEDVVRKKLKGKIGKHFSETDTEVRLILKKGRPTDEIIELVRGMSPDLMMLGKKSGYVGEGVMARRIIKYVPCSVLFVPEKSRNNLENILVPIDFTKTSADALTVAQKWADSFGGEVTAQHIFSYPTRFFPFLPIESEKEKIDDYIEKKLDTFTDEFDIPEQVDFRLSHHKEGRKSDDVYDVAVQKQADLIIMGAKSQKKLSTLLRDDFIDQAVSYPFGIPLLILKDKARHLRILDLLTGED